MRIRTIAALLFCLGSGSLFATWSIVAVDPATGQVGSAGASHTPAVWPIVGLLGGKGVLVAQAASNELARVEALAMLQEGRPPEEILKRITSTDFDPSQAHQQYGIVTLENGAASFTGAECSQWAGYAGDDHVRVQGNILVDEKVVGDALMAYNEALSQGLPLADRLVAALAAGSRAGGDKRAGAATAMTAYVAVANAKDPPGWASYAIIVPPQGTGVNPVPVLQDLHAKAAGKGGLYFPSLLTLVIWLLGVPLVISLVATVFVRVRKGRGPFGLRTFGHLGISVGACLGTFLLLLALLLTLRWAMPIYDVYGPVLALVLAIVSTVLFVIIRIGFMVFQSRE